MGAGLERGPMPRVLIVDDQPETAESLAELVRLWGHTVTIATDGPSALAAVAGDAPDVVVLDIGLPGMDGYEVARRLRARPGGERLVLLALTGHGTDEHLREADAAGFDHHVLKPIDFERLETLLVKPARRPHR